VGELLLGGAAGALTTLNPCVLPVLPFVVLAALDRHRFGPLALAAGMSATFAGVGLVVFGAGWASGVPGDAIRTVAAAIMALFGVLLLSAALGQRFAAAGAPISALFDRALERFAPQGLAGQFGLGALLGAVWSPCSGPTLGAAVTLAAGTATAARAGAIMLAFGAGASVPLLALAYGSREALKTRRELFARIARAARPALGTVLLAAGLLVLTGLDRSLEGAFVAHMPDWLVSLTTRY
jgi:cytochrome c biogenesis protein CcdA